MVEMEPCASSIILVTCAFLKTNEGARANRQKTAKAEVEYKTVPGEAEKVHSQRRAEMRIAYQIVAAEAEDLRPPTQMKGVLHVQPRESLPNDASPRSNKSVI